VEQKAGWCEKALSSVLDATAKKIRICARLQRSRNTDIKERRSTVGRETRRRWHLEEAAGVKGELQNSLQEFKRNMWGECWQNLGGAEEWRAA
jgi:hypothetical protein